VGNSTFNSSQTRSLLCYLTKTVEVDILREIVFEGLKLGDGSTDGNGVRSKTTRTNMGLPYEAIPIHTYRHIDTAPNSLRNESKIMHFFIFLNIINIFTMLKKM
jgi:hypothetical protein